MKYLLAIMLLSATLSVSANEVRPRRHKKEKTETAATPTATVATPAKPVAAPAAAEEPACETAPTDNDLTLGLTAQQADSLVCAWREQQRNDAFQQFFDDFIEDDSVAATGSTPDSVYIRRLRDLVSPIQLPYNSIVRSYIDRYVEPAHQGTISRILGWSKYYFPMIEQELIKAGLPVELRALPIIESALNPTAASRAGAVGLWQFMPTSGKNYGLEINSMVDERRDPIRSTEAAIRYLKDLYGIYNDWSLAIAAYNCGPGNVNKALARAGGNAHNFWDIYAYLPRETRGYLPAFIGATYAYAYHRLHGIEPAETPIPLATDTVHINRILHLGQIASTIDVPIETLRQLNPQYKLDIIPATTKSYTLVLPQRSVTDYITDEPAIYAKDSLYLKEYINPANISKKMLEIPATTYYTVRSGDTLGSIAHRYHTTVKQLMHLNHLKNANTLRLKQRLRVR